MTEACKCCKDDKPQVNGGGTGYGFNRLEGQARDWALANRFARSEYCVPVKGGKRFGGPVWQRIKCGDGRMGFSTRRKNQDDVRMERGMDGQWKKSRHTLVNRKSAVGQASRRPRGVDGRKVRVLSAAETRLSKVDPRVIRAEKALARIKNQPRRRMNRRERATRAATIRNLEMEIRNFT